MTDEDTIVAEEIIETEYGEKIVLDSPFDAKDFIKALPFNEYGEYLDYDSELAGSDIDDAIIEGVKDYGEFPKEYAAHATWDPDARGEDDGAWVMDVSAWDEASDWFEYAGFEVAVSDSIDL